LAHRLFAIATMALAVVASTAASPAAGAEREQYSGEILGVDRNAKTVTVRTPTSGGKETHVFRVSERSVLTDKKSGRTLAIEDLQAGDAVSLTSEHAGGERVVLQLTVRKTRESRGDDEK
jgi:Cu/Ag efflux protein CusF